MNEFLTFSKDQIYSGFITAAKTLILYKDAINKINFFPVADGDTGTNLNMMMNEFIERNNLFLSKELSSDEKDLNLFNNSRGTIGLIFYEYFKEFIRLEKDNISQNELIDLFKIGFLNVYKSLNNPVEGTIISLMKTWYQTLEEKISPKREFLDVVFIGLNDLEKELNKTRKLNKNLSKIDVPDSGSLAYFIFIDSFMHFLVNQKNDKNKYKQLLDNKKNNPEVKLNFKHSVLLTFRLVDSNNHIFNQISTYSFIECSSKIDNLYKLLLHTNSLQELSNSIINQINYEDIFIENLTLKNKALIAKEETCILTDSIADLPIYFNENKDIYTIDLKLHINQAIYIDRRTIKNEYFYELAKNKKNKMVSLPPSLKESIYILDFLTTYYKNIIVITVSDKLSETFNILNNASSNYKNQIYVLNSKEASVSQGLLVKYAQEQLLKKQDIQMTIELLKIAIENARMLMIAESVSKLNQSGRFKKSFGVMSKILKLNPVLSLDKSGSISHKNSALNELSAIKYIANKIQRDHQTYGVISYGIAHSDNLKVAELLRKELAKIIGKEPIYITNLSSVMTMHTGLGSCVVGYIKNEIKKA